jgi:competence protein ComEC
MIRWIPYTFIRIVLFFAGGIVLGIYQPEIIPAFAATTILIILVSLYALCFTLFRIVHKTFFNLGWIALPTVFLAGFINVLTHAGSRASDHFISSADSIQYYQVRINSYAEQKQKSWKMEGEVQRTFTDRWTPKSGKILLYFSKQDFREPWKYGDILMVKGSPQSVRGPANPGEFDYQRFLIFKNIYHQHFIREGQVRHVGNSPKFTVLKYAIEGRSWADGTLKRFVEGEREQGIASALVLGVTDGLDNELLDAYSATGAMHVLAVSGLHISIIYMILVWLLKPLNKLKSGPWLLAITGLFILWAYAFITGLSPSVLRAVTMFSFIALARPTNQSTNIYNTLAASAFCLLVFDPFLIMSVGFQLSYLAVLGIVFLQPRLYPLWEAKSYIGDQVWKITAVSIAAQLATFPLGLLYFHQFPNYFLISNLLVIPVSFVVLILGIVVLIFSFFHWLALAIGFLLMWSIKILNYTVFAVELMPFSLIEDIHISAFQCWLLVGVIVLIILLFESKRFSYAVAASTLMFIFAGWQWWHFTTRITLPRVTVYNVRGHSAIDFIGNSKTYFVSDSALSADANKIGFHIRPNRVRSGVNKVITGAPGFVRAFQGGKIISWNSLIIVQLTQKDFILPEQLNPDWIIVGNNAVRDIENFASTYKNPMIILDSSNSFYYSEWFTKEWKARNNRVHSVQTQGAFELTI